MPETSYTTPKLQHEYKHANDFGINGSCNKSKIKEYQQAIQNHINNASDIYISKYKGMDIYVYYDKKTGLGSYVDLNGNYVAGWKLSERQVNFHIKNGKKLK